VDDPDLELNAVLMVKVFPMQAGNSHAVEFVEASS